MSDLRTHLQGIYDSHRQLTPKLVVDEARSEEHPLHSRFEWDDAIAGEKYREVQAAELIRSVRIKFTNAKDDDRDVRAFHAVTRPEGNTYVPVEEIAEDEFARELLLRQAEREWKAFRRRYGHLSEFFAAIRGELNGEVGAA